MTFQTRTIERRTGTHWGDDRSHINRITLGAEPWAEAELKPELKPEHQRPAPGKLEAVFSAKSGGHVWDVIRTVRTPTIAKVRVDCPDTYANNDEDTLREHWIAGIPAKLRKGYREPRGYEPARPVDRAVLAAIVKHLRQSTDTRGGVMGALHLSEKTVDRAFRELRDTGVLSKRYDAAVKLCFYRVTE
jgi:hypothetical protein